MLHLSFNMTILYRLALLAVLLFALPHFSRATHITGADLTYECINPATNTYRITMTLYRDCQGGQAPFDPTITLFFFRGLTGSLHTTQTVNLPNNGIEIIPADWDACTGQPYNICMEYASYITTINLPPQVGGYNIGWARCCRNNVITNISANQGITVIAKVPGSEVPGCNSMPVFNQLPPLFLCVNQPFTFDHSATDIDGDSLVYTISRPLNGINTAGLGATPFDPAVSTGPFGNPMGPPPYVNVNFLPGYSFTDPFGSGNFHIDPQSGSLTLTPTQVGVSVYAVSVSEYRNGVLLSENKRDFQINVVTCQPQGATPIVGTDLTGLPNSSGDTIFARPLEAFCYDIDVTDPVPGDTVILYPISAAFGIGGTAPQPYATLNYSGINPASGQVCWTPPCAHAGDTIRLIVGGRDPGDCPGYNLAFDTTYVVVADVNRPLVSHSLPGGGDTIVVNANQLLCIDISATDADAADILAFVPVAGPFAGLGGTAVFANVTGQNPLAGDICWTPACTDAGQSFNLVFAAQDVNSCMLQGYDTVTVVVNPLPAVDAGVAVAVCAGQSQPLQASGGTAYAWSPATGLSNSNIANPIATLADSTLYTVSITDPLGCVQTDVVEVPVWPLPTAFAGNDTVNCPGAGVQLQGAGGLSYAWTPAASLSNATIANPLASPLAPTPYTLTVTDANGCQDTDEVLVTPMNAVAGPDQAICAGQSLSLTASGGIAYSWNNAASLSNPNIANPTASPTATTTYTVTVTDAFGCTDTDQVTVFVNPLPNADAGPNTVICPGNAATLNASGGIAYAWQPNAALSSLNVSNPVATPALTTTFFVSVTDANGCVATDSVTVTASPLPLVDAGADTTQCGDTGVQLNATGGLTYTWSPAAGLSNANIANPIASPAIATLYTVTATDANGCVNSDQVLVSTLYADAGPNDTICLGGTAQLQAAAGGLAYSWNNAATLSNAAIANPAASPLSTTLYTLTTTFFPGCTDTDTARVVVRALPAIDAGALAQLCVGDSVNLLATGGVSYVWNADPALIGINLSNPLVFPQVTQQFFVTGTDANGCTNQDSVTVQVNPLPLVDAGNDTAKCGGLAVMLNASGGVAYNWLAPATSLSDPLISNPLANPDSSTTYVVAITDANGCVNTDSVFVRVMYANAGPDATICMFDSVQLQASNGVAYQWDASPFLVNGNTATPTVFPQVDTDFYVTVSDTSGCTARDTVRVTVTAPPATTASGTDPWVCSGGATVFNATGGVTYAWTPANAFADPTLASATAFPVFSGNSGAQDTTLTFYVEVTNANGCRNYDSLQQVVRILPLITASNDTVRCPGATVPLFATGGVQYAWSPAASLSNANLANPLASPDVTTTYTVAVTDVWGCMDTREVKVIVMNPDAGADATICAADTVQLSGSGGVAYVWNNAATLSNANVANPFAFPLTTTQYILTVTDSLGCVDTDTVNVLVNPLPPADAGEDATICAGSTTQLSASGGMVYTWSPVAGLDNPAIANPVASPAADVQYVVTVSDANGCTAADSVRVTVNPLPPVDAGADQTICGRDAAFLQGSGALTYAWTPVTGLSDPTAADPLANPDNTTTYLLSGTDANGCVNTDEITVTVLPLPVATGDPVAAICLGQSATLAVSGAQEYRWSTGQGGASISVSPGNTTAYWVIPFNGGCAGDTFFFQVQVERNLPRANFVASVTEGFAPLDVVFENTSQNATTFLWNFGDGLTSEGFSPLHTYEFPGQFTVTLTADNDIGCPDTYVFRFIQALDFQIFFPNAFSPNGDGYNDEFVISASAVASLQVQIFNRWGERVYASDDVNFRWDGRDERGRAVQEGVYVYRVVATSFRGEKIERGGSVTLIR